MSLLEVLGLRRTLKDEIHDDVAIQWSINSFLRKGKEISIS